MSLAGNAEWVKFEETRRYAWAAIASVCLATLASNAFNRIDVKSSSDPDLDKYGNGAAFYVIGNLGTGMLFTSVISGSYRTMVAAVVVLLCGVASCVFGIIHEITQPGKWINWNMAYWMTDLAYTLALVVSCGIACALASHLAGARNKVIREAMNKDRAELTAMDRAAVGELNLCLSPVDYAAGYTPYWLLGKGFNNVRKMYAAHVVTVMATVAGILVHYGGFIGASWNAGFGGEPVLTDLGQTVWLVDVAPNYAGAGITYGISNLFVGAQIGLLVSPSIRAQVPALLLGVPALVAAVLGNVYERAYTRSTFTKTMTIVHTVATGALVIIALVRFMRGATVLTRHSGVDGAKNRSVRAK